MVAEPELPDQYASIPTLRDMQEFVHVWALPGESPLDAAVRVFGKPPAGEAVSPTREREA